MKLPMMKKPSVAPIALAFATLLAMAVGGCGGGTTTPAKPTGAPSADCAQMTIHTSDQYDACRNKCRSEKQVREQSCGNDTQCMMAAGSRTEQCFGKCEEGRNNARAKNCYTE
jgi:hypothetical protein